MKTINDIEKKFTNKNNIPSLLKWTGSKRLQANKIYSYFPKYDRYFEPFLGGGSTLYLASKPRSVAGDIYPPLVDLWIMVQQDVWKVIEDYNTQWHKLQENLPDYYYEVRDRFNSNPNGLDLSFLMRTCVNGIVRFNKNGDFNNSFHLSRKGMNPSRFEKIALDWHKRIKGIEFKCGDYIDTISTATENDIVYLDPPYAGSKNRYTNNLDVDKLFNTLEDLNKRNVKWCLSFDGERGEENLTYPVPPVLFKRQVSLSNGNSAVGKVLNSSINEVKESLYLNY